MPIGDKDREIAGVRREVEELKAEVLELKAEVARKVEPPVHRPWSAIPVPLLFPADILHMVFGELVGPRPAPFTLAYEFDSDAVNTARNDVLSRLALVCRCWNCRCWNGVATPLLYGDLRVVWRCRVGSKLVRSFRRTRVCTGSCGGSWPTTSPIPGGNDTGRREGGTRL